MDINVKSSILITSISKKIPLIEAVKNAAHKLGDFQNIFGCDADLTCIGKYWVDEFWHCPPIETLSIEEVIQFCLKNKISVILPTRNDDVVYFSHHVEELKKKNIYVM